MNVDFSDAAANTVISPVTLVDDAAAPVDDAGDDPVCDDEQPATRAAAPMSPRRCRDLTSSTSSNGSTITAGA